MLKPLPGMTLKQMRSDPVNAKWNYISKKYTLSSDLIEEFSFYLNWDAISSLQALEEHIILKFADRLVWKHISKNQQLTMKILEENDFRVFWGKVSDNVYGVSEEILLRFHTKLNWNRVIFNTDKISLSFIERHAKLQKNLIHYSILTSGKPHREIPDDWTLRNIDMFEDYSVELSDYSDYDTIKQYKHKFNTYRINFKKNLPKSIIMLFKDDLQMEYVDISHLPEAFKVELQLKGII